MKVYIHNRKNGETYEKAMTVYTNRGKMLYSITGRILEDNMQKFDKTLYALEWGIKHFRSIASSGILSEKEPVKLYMSSKTIYDWLEKEKCPHNYIGIFSNIQMELSLIVNDVEIIYTENNRAKYLNSEKESISMKDLFKDFEGIDN